MYSLRNLACSIVIYDVPSTESKSYFEVLLTRQLLIPERKKNSSHVFGHKNNFTIAFIKSFREHSFTVSFMKRFHDLLYMFI